MPEACPTCGAERRLVGILYPVRKLCPCEVRVCHCKEAAVVVEFQKPVKDKEPKLPAKSAKKASFLCKEHCPGDFPLDEPEEAKVSRRPLPDRIEKFDGVAPNAPRKGKDLPHIDPVLERLDITPPVNSTLKYRVECVVCKHIHRLCDRKMWNESYSYCPECGESMYVPLWTEEEGEAHATPNVR